MLNICLNNSYSSQLRSIITYHQNRFKLFRVVFFLFRRFFSAKALLIKCKKLELLRQENIKNATKINNDLIYVISDVDVLMLSYRLIMDKPSKMTNSLNSSTFRYSELCWLKNLSYELLADKYFLYCNRKKKVIQKAICLVLEAIWYSRSLCSSNNFLNTFKSTFKDVSCIIRIDLIDRVDAFDHKVLIDLISKRVNCKKTIMLLLTFLEKNFFLLNKNNNLNEINNILYNILLHEFYVFVKKYNLLQKHKHNKKVVYVRYSNDLFIGANGNINDIILIKNKILSFLGFYFIIDILKIKTLYLNKQQFFFLGFIVKNKKIIFDFYSSRNNKSKAYSPINLYIPLCHLFFKFKKIGFFKIVNDFFKPKSVRRFINLEHRDILMVYSNIIRGVYSYYSYVNNQKNIRRLLYGLKASCALTLAFKFKSYRRSKTYKELGGILNRRAPKQIFSPPSVYQKVLFYNPPKTNFSLFYSALFPKFYNNCNIYRLIAVYKFGFISFWSMQSLSFDRF